MQTETIIFILPLIFSLLISPLDSAINGGFSFRKVTRYFAIRLVISYSALLIGFFVLFRGDLYLSLFLAFVGALVSTFFINEIRWKRAFMTIAFTVLGLIVSFFLFVVLNTNFYKDRVYPSGFWLTLFGAPLAGFIASFLWINSNEKVIRNRTPELKPKSKSTDRESVNQWLNSSGIHAAHQSGVFISYRRNTSKFIARSIFEDLRHQGYNIFMDVESIDSGQFEKVILNQIAARAHFLVILTDGAVERCADPQDWLRREIEYAIDMERNIVPILVEDFTFQGTEKYLTGKLANLSTYNALTLHHDYFDEAMQRLRSRFLKQPVYGKIIPTPSNERAIVEQKLNEIDNQPKPTATELNAEAYIERGNRHFSRNEYDQALSDYDKALSLEGDYALAYYNRGMTFLELGKIREAVTDYTKVIKLEPGFARAYYHRANLLNTAKQYEKALVDYQKYLDLGGGHENNDQNQVQSIIQNLQKQIS